ncbi:hypothetical protein Tco_0951969 [Tanacetum coccineum]|uniref:Uncharacterized protein n=1 Tax=Tanacetum coccineum TaxID=301880 RepID=A0ABQ5E2F9_9ASTR
MIEEDSDERVEYLRDLFLMSDTSSSLRKVSSIPIGGSISSEGFLSSILLSMVIIVTVVIVVVDDLMLPPNLRLQAVNFFNTSGGSLGPVFLLGLSAFAMVAACASRAAVKSAISFRRASKVMAGVSDVDVLLGAFIRYLIVIKDIQSFKEGNT